MAEVHNRHAQEGGGEGWPPLALQPPRLYVLEIPTLEPQLESLAMWRELGPEVGQTPDDCVCGCGAGAAPDLRSLPSSPWTDARAAAYEDGRPVFAVEDGAYHRP